MEAKLESVQARIRHVQLRIRRHDDSLVARMEIASLPRLQDEERRLRAAIAAAAAAAAGASAGSDPAPLQDSSNRPGTAGGLGGRPGTAGGSVRPGTAASTACGTTARRSVTGSAPCPGALSSTGGLVVSATDRFTSYPYRPAVMAAEMNMRDGTTWGEASLSQTSFLKSQTSAAMAGTKRGPRLSTGSQIPHFHDIMITKSGLATTAKPLPLGPGEYTAPVLQHASIASRLGPDSGLHPSANYGVAVPSRRPRISVPLHHRVEVPEEVVSLALYERAQAKLERLRQDEAEATSAKHTIATLDMWELEHVPQGASAVSCGSVAGTTEGGGGMTSRTVWSDDGY